MCSYFKPGVLQFLSVEPTWYDVAFNTTLSQSHVLLITMVNITCQSGDQYLSSIHSWDSNPWLVLYIPLFLIFFFLAIVLNCFSCSSCISGTRINLSIFLFKSKFLSFQVCDCANLLSYYYYYYKCYFCFYSLLLLFSTCFVLLLFLIFTVL